MGRGVLADRFPIYGLMGEMSAEVAFDKIPLSDEAKASLEKLMEGDEDPCLVAVEIVEGKGGHGNYTAEAIKDIVSDVNTKHPMGFLGHQRPEDVSFEFPAPAVHWYSAEMERKGGKAVAKLYGLIDPAMKQLKKWVRSGRINAVSIFGRPMYKPGTRDVVGYDLLSVDFVPRGRQGMTTRLLWASEMKDGLAGELDGSYEELREAIRVAAKEALGKGYAWVERLYTDNTVIVSFEPDGATDRKLYRFDYVVDGDRVTLSNRTEVVEQRTYEPTGEMESAEKRKGVDNMTLAEMLATIRSSLAKGEANVKDILGEIGITREQAIDAVAKDEWDKMAKGAKFGMALKESLGLCDEMTLDQAKAMAGEMAAVWNALGFNENKPENPAAVVGEMVQAQAEAAKAAREKLVDDTIKEKVSGEQAQVLIKRMLNVAEDATKEQIVGEIDALLADEAIRSVLGKSFVDQPVGGGGKSKGSDKRQYTSTKRAAI